MAEDLIIHLQKNEDNASYGFSLLGTKGPPHIIYDIQENSPAAGKKIEAGDIIVKVNGTDVHRYTTKEVLKCLRLSDDLVTLELKRDPNIKNYIKEYLARTSNNLHNSDVEPLNLNIYDIKPSTNKKSSDFGVQSQQKSPTNSNTSSCSSPRLLNSPTNSDSSSSLCRKSRIPQAVKSPPGKPTQSPPQQKKKRPSHIPTTASIKSPSISSNGSSSENNSNNSSENPLLSNRSSDSSSLSDNNSYNHRKYLKEQQQHLPPQPTSAPPLGKARFEAYMMTGDLILNLSRTPQSTNLIAASHSKKVDSLRDSPSRRPQLQNQYSLPQQNGIAPRASSESTPSSSAASPINSDGSDSNCLHKNKDNKIKKDYCNISNPKINRNGNSDIIPQRKYSGESDNEQIRHNIDSVDYSNYQQRVQTDGGQKKLPQHSRLLLSELNDDTSALSITLSSSSTINNLPTNSNCPTKTVKRVYNSTEYNIESSHRKQHYSSSSSTIKSGEGISSPEETSFSVPTSPVSLSTPLIEGKELITNSLPTSPEVSTPAEVVIRRQNNGIIRKCDSAGFRTSKSEDHLQQTQREGIGAVIPIDIDEDVNSSLNTLLDTRQDSEDSQSSNRDRIVWTYNAPVPQQQLNQTISPNSHSSSISTSPQHTTDSPASPTSVSSSVMSSNSGSKGALTGVTSGNVAGGTSGYSASAGGLSTNYTNSRETGHSAAIYPPNGNDQSVSEAISNISSPDYQDDDNLLSSRDIVGISLSDPSDSDSTILVSEAMHQKQQQKQNERDHKIVIQVKGNGGGGDNAMENSKLQNSEDELATITEDVASVTQSGVNYYYNNQESSPPVSDDGSDVDSLHSYHYSPKAVDMPSAIRLAKRLYSLDGFKKSDVSRHLSKNNDFSRAVADEYLKYFNFDKKTLDQSLREFLQQFALSGETQERERVLVHFSKRYLDCNPGTFNSQDAVHTLTCAIMLLNTDLHGQNIGRKMTCSEFVDNLADLNDGENFPKDILKYLYQAIKNHPLEWALDDENVDQQKQANEINMNINQIGQNPFLDLPQSSAAIEYKKGYVMRKSCYESNYKKTPFGKRSWKMFYCTLRDLVLYLHKDEHGFRKSQMSDNLHNAIRIHHGLATKANDYTKKQHVFRLQTADQSEFLFQTSDSKELQSWIDTINYVCATFSAPPLEGGVGSQKRFQRPLLPSTHTKLLMAEQLRSHELHVEQLEEALNEHKKGPVPSKGLALQNYKEKENYLQFELKRYKTYVNVLNAKALIDQQQLQQQQELQNNCLQEDYQSRIINPVGGITSNLIQQQHISESIDTSGNSKLESPELNRK